ncbi:MAG: nucleotidyltransferase family protein [Acidobacteriota bacterium]|nr:nucleotidyltransferase family protein [Acidobacteriota bacterium]
MIWTLILAAGRSERMGSAKLLLPWGDKTVIEAVVRAALDSEADGTAVVVGSRSDEIGRAIEKYPVHVLDNPDFEKGMLSSVQRGFDGIPEGGRAVLVLLGDQPFITGALINQVISAYRETGKGIVLPVHEGRRGHPVLFDLKYRNDVMGLDPEIGLRELLRRHPGDIFALEVENPGVGMDLDTPEDYARVTRRTGR